MFRNEGNGLSSCLIREAVAHTRWKWPNTPALGMVTFIDPAKVKPRKIRGRPTWGHSYFEAGFHHVGYTKGGLWAFLLRPEDMPEAVAPMGVAAQMFPAVDRKMERISRRIEAAPGP